MTASATVSEFNISPWGIGGFFGSRVKQVTVNRDIFDRDNLRNVGTRANRAGVIRHGQIKLISLLS